MSEQAAGVVTITFLTREERKKNEKLLAEKVGTLNLTWADMDAMDFESELKEKEFIDIAMFAKANVRNAQFIFLAGRPFVHRTISRRELATVRVQVATIAQAKTDAVPAGIDPQVYGNQLMRDALEEEMVMLCSVWPKFDRLTVKEEDAGIITSLHDSILASSGFSQNAVPVKL